MKTHNTLLKPTYNGVGPEKLIEVIYTYIYIEDRMEICELE